MSFSDRILRKRSRWLAIACWYSGRLAAVLFSAGAEWVWGENAEEPAVVESIGAHVEGIMEMGVDEKGRRLERYGGLATSTARENRHNHWISR